MKSRIATLAQDIDVLYADVSGDEASRKQLFGVIQGAMAKVESPTETIWRMIMSVRYYPFEASVQTHPLKKTAQLMYRPAPCPRRSNGLDTLRCRHRPRRRRQAQDK